MKLRIAFLQLLPGTMLQEQLEQGVRACREAKAQGADIALFPEMWSTGYRILQDLPALQREAISLDDAFVQTFKELAAELEMAIGITFLGKNVDEHDIVGKPFNSVALFDRHGELALHYAKVHACDFSEENQSLFISSEMPFFATIIVKEVIEVLTAIISKILKDQIP